MTLGQTIRKFREGKNVSVMDLADKVYVHYNTFYKYERDDFEPKLSMVISICNVLNVSVIDLLKEVDGCQNSKQ